MKSIQYKSNTTNSTRTANVILPDHYTEEKKYPILYLLHGIGGDQMEWLQGEPDSVVNGLVAKNEAKEMILVLPNVRARQNDVWVPEETYTLEHYKSFDNFINDLRDDLMPFMEANFSVAKGRENTAIAGLSMGGRESLYIGLSMPETFSYIGAFCPAPGLLAYSLNGVTEDGLFTEDTLKISDEYNKKTKIMIVSGDSDTVVSKNPERYHKTLEKNGTEHTYFVQPGGHDFGVWKVCLEIFAKRVFQ